MVLRHRVFSRWLAIVGLVCATHSGCAIYPDSAADPRTKAEAQSEQPPADVEQTPVPKRPATTCPPAMRGSC